jgi:hypothetical protein
MKKKIRRENLTQKQLNQLVLEQVQAQLAEYIEDDLSDKDQLMDDIHDLFPGDANEILQKMVSAMSVETLRRIHKILMQDFSGNPDYPDYSGYEDEEMMGMSGIEEAAKAKKTEHSGAKKGKGAYYGRKKDAKKDSKKARRENDKKETDLKEQKLRPDQILKIAGHLKKTGVIRRIADVRTFLADKANIHISPDDATTIHRLAIESFERDMNSVLEEALKG